MMYELSCKYDSRASFYGKAQVKEENKRGVQEITLYSYGTIVAKIIRKSGKMICKYYGKYSPTTTRHQKEFFKQNYLSDKEIKELWKKGEIEI